MSGEDAEVRPVAVAEGSSNGSSGSPSPGDTLPWNLGKTQRSRRSGGGPVGNGSVLDPAERAVIRIAGNGEGSCPLASLAQVLSTLYVLRADAGLRERPGTSAMREGLSCPGADRQQSSTCWLYLGSCRRLEVLRSGFLLPLLIIGLMEKGPDAYLQGE